MKVGGIIVASLAVPVLAACSDDPGDATCLRDGDAEVCAERDNDTTVTVSSEGLQPGSELELVNEETGTTGYSVGPNGELDGLVAIVSFIPSSPVEVQVEATTATGAVLEGTLVIE